VNLPGGTSIVYSYDHQGKRIGKTAGGATVDYYLDGDYVIMEAQGASVMVYYTQVQGLISQRRGSSSYFYHYDGLGSTKALTDVNQNIQASYIYDAWGNILQTNGTVINPYIYVGELGYYADGDASMYLLTQRWYNPIVGRFVVRDFIRERGKNLYAFALSDPVALVDPSGLEEKCPGLDQLSKKAKECFYECTYIGWAHGRPYFYFDLSCLKKCLEKKMDSLLAEFMCCAWWTYMYGGEGPSKDAWVVHPCSETNYPGAEQMDCERCCDFQTCLCQVKDFASPEIQLSQCGIFRKGCYFSCADKNCPKYFHFR